MCLFWAPLFCTVIDAICGTYFYDVFYFDHKSGMAKMDKLEKELGLGVFDRLDIYVTGLLAIAHL